MRDPLYHPRPGDVVESKKGRKREVAYVTITGVVLYDRLGKKVTADHRCDLATWRRWAQEGTVIKRGKDGPVNPHERPIETDYYTEGQVTGIANQIMDDANRGCGVRISGTPSDEVVRALFEIGLAHYRSYSWDTRKVVEERVQELYDAKMAARRAALGTG